MPFVKRTDLPGSFLQLWQLEQRFCRHDWTGLASEALAKIQNEFRIAFFDLANALFEFRIVRDQVVKTLIEFPRRLSKLAKALIELYLAFYRPQTAILHGRIALFPPRTAIPGVPVPARDVSESVAKTKPAAPASDRPFSLRIGGGNPSSSTLGRSLGSSSRVAQPTPQFTSADGPTRSRSPRRRTRTTAAAIASGWLSGKSGETAQPGDSRHRQPT